MRTGSLIGKTTKRGRSGHTIFGATTVLCNDKQITEVLIEAEVNLSCFLGIDLGAVTTSCRLSEVNSRHGLSGTAIWEC